MGTLLLSVLRCPDHAVPEQRRLAGGRLSIGRSAQPGEHWVLPDPTRVVSGLHAEVEFLGGDWVVTDRSTNGTFVNHDADPLGKDRARPLLDGDRLRIGPYEIEVRVEAGAAGASSGGWGADPFAPVGPAPGFGAAPLPGMGAPPMTGGGLLPDDFDPLGDGGAPMPDHAPATAEAFLPRPVLPAGPAMIPDDWDLDLSPQPALPPRPDAGPFAAPGPAGFAPPPPPAQPAFAPPAATPYASPAATPFAPPVETPFAPPAATPFPPPMPGPFAAPVATPVGPPFAAPVAAAFAPAAPDPFAAPMATPTAPPAADPFAPAPPAAFAAPPAAPADPFAAPAMPLGQPATAPAPPHAAAPTRNPFDEAPAPTPPPAAAPPAPAAGDALSALLAGADLPAGMAARAAADPDAALRAAGALLRAAVAGMRALLIARADVKREFRIEQTMLRAANNNPLKFAATEEQALAALLDPRTPALKAMQETVDDLTAHQVATLAATQAAARALLDRLAPGPIEAEDSGGGILPGAKEKRLWEAYKRRHAQLLDQFEDDFDSAFGKAFARAYEQATGRKDD